MKIGNTPGHAETLLSRLRVTDSRDNHEQFDRSEEVKGSTDRSFGITFSIICAVVALWPLLGGSAPRWFLLLASGALLILGLAVPRVLHPLNRIWLKIGLLLHAIVSPIVLGLIFFGVISPIGIGIRLFGKDPLRLRFEKRTTTYWIARQPPGPAPKSMTRQF